MTAPFDASAHHSAHVLLDRLIELEVPLSRDVMYALEHIIVTGRWDRALWTTPWFRLEPEPQCSTCGAAMAASRTVQVTDTETVERRLYECGSVEAEHTGSVLPRELLAPCGDTERRVAAELARAGRFRDLADAAERDMPAGLLAGPPEDDDDTADAVLRVDAERIAGPPEDEPDEDYVPAHPDSAGHGYFDPPEDEPVEDRCPRCDGTRESDGPGSVCTLCIAREQRLVHDGPRPLTHMPCPSCIRLGRNADSYSCRRCRGTGMVPRD